MSDIVERLRDYDIGNMEAADEVERILAENKELRLELDMQRATTLIPSQKYDQRRIERLDAALAEALDEAAALRAENEKFFKQAEMNARLLTENTSLSAEKEHLANRELKLLRDLEKLAIERQALREALKPFAYYASLIPDDISDTCSASGTVGDLRAAAAAIRESGDE